MVIELDSVSNEYVKESGYAKLMFRTLIKYPLRNINDYYIKQLLALALYISVLVFELYAFIHAWSIYAGIYSGLFIDVVVKRVIKCIGIRKGIQDRKKLLANSKNIYELEPESITYVYKTDTKTSTIKVNWDSFHCLRITKAGIYLIPYSKEGTIMSMPVEKLDTLRSFINENNIKLDEYCD